MGFIEGGSGMLKFPASKCPDRQARVKDKRVLPKVRHPYMGSFGLPEAQWPEYLINE